MSIKILMIYAACWLCLPLANSSDTDLFLSFLRQLSKQTNKCFLAEKSPGKGSLTDTVVTFLENDSKSFSESISKGLARPGLFPFTELTNSDCSLRPLYSKCPFRQWRPLHSMGKDHQNWPSTATGLPISGSLNVLHSTWRDPHFEFYLVSHFNFTLIKGESLGYQILATSGTDNLICHYGHFMCVVKMLLYFEKRFYPVINWSLSFQK